LLPAAAAGYEITIYSAKGADHRARTRSSRSRRATSDARNGIWIYGRHVSSNKAGRVNLRGLPHALRATANGGAMFRHPSHQ